MTEYNADELVAPQWLNTDFFIDVLCSYEELPLTAVKVHSFKIQPATKKGDHYASVMFRVILKYQLQNGKVTEKSLIIKTMPDVDSEKRDLLEETSIFETEIAMYTEVIPRFENILRAANDNTILGISCLYYSLSPRKLIVFEDLVPAGYTAFRTPPTLGQAKWIYMKLAKWHAISYKLIKETPQYFNKFRDEYFNMDAMVDSDFYKCGIKNFIDLLQSVPTLRSYKNYFERVQDTLLDDCRASISEYRSKTRADAFYVLCHGDFHANNLMISMNPLTKQWQDIMFLDFQMCNVAPIAIDLLYSMFLMLDDSLRSTCIDELLYHYFQIFIDTLKTIGYDGELPKLRAFREQLFWHRHWELFLLTTYLPVWSGIRNGNIDVSSLLATTEYARNIYRNESYVKELHVLLARYRHLGYFEE